jgi:tetratricopeptide (TPR) repeat protein
VIRGKDRDSADDANRVRLVVWSLAPAALGAIAGGLLAPEFGRSWAIGFLGGGLVAGGVSVVLVGYLADRAGRAAASLYAGGSHAMPDQFSLVDSLIARGHIEQAAAELRRATDASGASAPAIRLARLLRDRLNRPEEALQWFRAALECDDLDDGAAHLLLREVVELCRTMGETKRALPVLAKVAARRPDSHIVAWARETSHSIRQEASS